VSITRENCLHTADFLPLGDRQPRSGGSLANPAIPFAPSTQRQKDVFPDDAPPRRIRAVEVIPCRISWPLL
jgi:hypothetical protein